jgi:hypothetical protein
LRTDLSRPVSSSMPFKYRINKLLIHLVLL